MESTLVVIVIILILVLTNTLSFNTKAGITGDKKSGILGDIGINFHLKNPMSEGFGLYEGVETRGISAIMPNTPPAYIRNTGISPAY